MSKSGKGSGFERDLAKRLSLWWTDGERGDVIWRTSQSGGRATQRAKSAVRTKYGHGDLTFTDPIAKPLFDLLVISAKRGYTNTSKPLSSAELEKTCDRIESCKRGGFKAVAKKEVSKLFSRTKKSGGLDLLDFIDKPHKSHNTLQEWLDECYRDRDLAQVAYYWLIFRRDGGEACCLMSQALHLELARYAGRITLPQFGANCLLVHHDNGNQVVASLEDVLQWCSPAAIAKLSDKFVGVHRVQL